MTVYVDNFQKMGKLGERDVFWSHLIADTPEELAEFAARLGLVRRCDESKCTYRSLDHVDVTESDRQEALHLGAKYITYSEFGEIVKARRAAARKVPSGSAGGTSRSEADAGDGPRYNPNTQNHSWIKTKIHVRDCRHCGLHVLNEHADDRVTWWQTWTWPDNRQGTNRGTGTTRIPKCPGPPQEATAGAA